MTHSNKIEQDPLAKELETLSVQLLQKIRFFPKGSFVMPRESARRDRLLATRDETISDKGYL
jgi:hypothetical protein